MDYVLIIFEYNHNPGQYEYCIIEHNYINSIPSVCGMEVREEWMSDSVESLESFVELHAALSSTMYKM